MNDDIMFIQSSGNIFADLGFDDPDYELNRADLAIDLSKRIRELGISVEEAATTLEVQPQVIVDVLDGDLSDVTVENLMSYLARLGQPVEIVVHPASTSMEARVTVSRSAA